MELCKGFKGAAVQVKIYNDCNELVTVKIKVLLYLKSATHVKGASAELRLINPRQCCMHYKRLHPQLLFCSTGSRACLLLREAAERGRTWHRWKGGRRLWGATLHFEERENSLLGQILKARWLTVLSYSQFRFYRLLCTGIHSWCNEITLFLNTEKQHVISNPRKAAFNIIRVMLLFMYLQLCTADVYSCGVFESVNTEISGSGRAQKGSCKHGGHCFFTLIIPFWNAH